MVNVTRPLCSPPCWCIRLLQRWAWERVGHGKLLLRCRLLSGERAPGGGEGRGHTMVAAHLQLVRITTLQCIYYISIQTHLYDDDNNRLMDIYTTPCVSQ